MRRTTSVLTTKDCSMIRSLEEEEEKDTLIIGNI